MEERILTFKGKIRKYAITALLWLFAMFLSLKLVQYWVIDVCHVPTDSMESAIMAGDRVAVRKNWRININRFDLIVFHHPNGEDIQLVKRCIGLPGDTVSMVRGAIYINGKISVAIPTVQKFPHDLPLLFPLRSLGWDTNNFGSVVTPAKGLSIPLDSANMNLYRNMIRAEEHEVSCLDTVFYIDGNATKGYTFRSNGYFVLGDNRGNSFDSRHWGFVPDELIVGRVVMVVFSRDAARKRIRLERTGKRVSYLHTLQ